MMILSLLWAGCSPGSETAIECYSTSRFRTFANPSFSTYIMNVQAGGRNRTDIYVQMPYRHLRFEKQADVFTASYSMTFIIRNDRNEIVHTKEIDRPITVRTYDETVSPRLDIHFQTFHLSPGLYTVEMISVDNVSTLRYRTKELLSVAGVEPVATAASTILFLDDMDVDAKGVTLRPIFPSSLSLLKDSLGMFQELYHLSPNDTVTVTDTYSRQSHTAENERQFPYLMPPYSLQSNRCANPYDSVYYRSDSMLVAVRSGTLQYIRFHPVPENGSSNIERRIIVRNTEKRDTVRYSRNIFRREFRLRSALSVEEIASAMKFIMREDEFDSLMAAEGEERIQRIRQFWEQRGGAARRVEFERKIMEANTLFTTCVDGSKSAMGIVYFICGTPDFIDCRGSYIETWYYNIGERAYAFQFRRDDEQYRHFELTPYSVNESVWQYFVDRWRKKS